MTTTENTTDTAKLKEAFTLLTKHMTNRGKHQEINAHCVAKHRLPVIALHGSDEVSDEAKLETYRECLEALASDNYGSLQGEVPKGQVKGGTGETPKKPEKAPESPEKKPEPSKAGTDPVPNPEPKSNGQGGGNKDAEQLVDILGRLVGSKTGKAEVDEDKVREIVRKEVRKVVAEEIAKIDVEPRAWVEVKFPDGEVVKISDICDVKDALKQLGTKD